MGIPTSGEQRRFASDTHGGDEGHLSPDPLLAAIENFRGSFVDLDRQLTVDAVEFAAQRYALAKKLAAAGLRTGERVVVAIGNGPQFVAALDAVLRCGASPLLVHFQLPAAELKRTALRYGATWILTDEHPDDPRAAIGEHSIEHQLDWLHCVQTPVDPAEPGFRGDFPPLVSVPLHPTSGSTGMPKIAARPGPCAVAEGVNYIGATGVDRHDSLLVVTPMSHAYAYGMGMTVPLLSHARILSLRKFALKTVLDALEQHEISVLPAVPAMLDMLLFGKGAKLLCKPRMVLTAGAPLTRRTAENFLQITGRLICPLYGTTETGGITVGAQGVLPAEVQSVGQTLSGVRARIEPASDASLAAGVGRVAIRSTSMMAGYFSTSGIDRSPLPGDWFVTGDLGRIAAGNTLQLLGRESEIINVAGMKVIPREVEEVLAAFPGVVECKVYAGTHRAGTQMVKAAVVGDASLDANRLRDFCKEQLVYYKQPSAYALLAALPRSPAGKILKDQLP